MKYNVVYILADRWRTEGSPRFKKIAGIEPADDVEFL